MADGHAMIAAVKITKKGDAERIADWGE